MTDSTTPNDSRTAASADTPLSTAQLSALEAHTVELQHSNPMQEFSRPEAFSHLLDSGRIVALGEATHGTREFFRLKHRFLRYLVLECGARVFAMEANFPETLALNEYVLYGTGDPRDALENIYFWTWNVESVLELVEWLREFNDGRPSDDRVRFYGFDAQYTTGAVSRLDAYLDAVDACLPGAIRDDLALVDDGGTNPDQDEQTDARLDAGERVVPALREHLDEHREAYVSREGERSFELAKQHLTVIEQATEYRRERNSYDGGFDDDLTAEQRRALERLISIRDRAMADNVDWLLEFEEPDRLVLWAHDAHVNREKHAVRGTGAVGTPMGGFLDERHGGEYVPVGFSFGRGSFQAISQTEEAGGESSYELREQTLQSSLSGTIDAVLDEFDAPICLVDLQEAKAEDALESLLCQSRPHFSAGAMYDPENPGDYLTEYVYGEAFDTLCFVGETTRARPVDSESRE